MCKIFWCMCAINIDKCYVLLHHLLESELLFPLTSSASDFNICLISTAFLLSTLLLVAPFHSLQLSFHLHVSVSKSVFLCCSTSSSKGSYRWSSSSSANTWWAPYASESRSFKMSLTTGSWWVKHFLHNYIHTQLSTIEIARKWILHYHWLNSV